MPYLTWMGQHPWLTVIIAYFFFQSMVYMVGSLSEVLRKPKVELPRWDDQDP